MDACIASIRAVAGYEDVGDLASVVTAVQSCRAQVEEQATYLSTVQAKNKTVEKELQESRAKITELRGALTEVLAMNDTLSSAANIEADDAIDAHSLNEMVGKLQVELVKVQDELVQAQAQTREQASRYEDQIQRLQAANDTLSAGVDALTVAKETAEDVARTRKAEIEQLTNKVKTITQQLPSGLPRPRADPAVADKSAQLQHELNHARALLQEQSEKLQTAMERAGQEAATHTAANDTLRAQVRVCGGADAIG